MAKKDKKDRPPIDLLASPIRCDILKFIAKKGQSFNSEIAKSITNRGVIGIDESVSVREILKLKLNGYLEEVIHPENDKKKFYMLTAKGKQELKEHEKDTD